MRRPATETPGDSAESAVEVPQAPLGSALLRLVRAHRLLGTSLLASIGLVPPQELILLRLEEHGTLPQSDIVRFFNRDRSTVSNTLQAMERANLIVRAASPNDGRALDTMITDAGRALCPAIRNMWAELEQATFGHLDTDARAALLDELTTARERLVMLSSSRG